MNMFLDVGSKCGKIVEALRQTGQENPLILLDEIDKMKPNSDAQGALLEVFDVTLINLVLQSIPLSAKLSTFLPRCSPD